MNTEYSEKEVPLVAGSIFGLRMFVVANHHYLDKEPAMLSGPVYQMDWTEGENVAECRQMEAFCFCHDCDTRRKMLDIGVHPVATAACNCGFYAFHTYDPETVLALQAMGRTVMGVIEGYGRITLGTKGFKCEKAKIRALAPIPDPADYLLGTQHAEFWLQPHILSQFQISPSMKIKVEEAYPNIPFYRTMADVLEAFPLTPVENYPQKVES